MDRLRPYHVVLDGVLPKQPDRHRIRTVLHALVTATGLTRIGPEVIHVDDETQHWTALQCIAESHVAMSGVGRIACVDVFSCRPIDGRAVGETLLLWLGGRWIEDDARPMDARRLALYAEAEAAL